MTTAARATSAALLRLDELDPLVYAHLARAVQVVKLAYELAEGSVYEDNKEDFESEALHRINELTNQRVPASEDWEFKHVSIIADATGITDALTKMSAKADPAYDKTRVCIHHQLGACNKAGKCKFAHSKSELAPGSSSQWDLYKTHLCNKWPNCEHGKTCLYAHGEGELRTPPAAASDALSDDWLAFADVFINIYVGVHKESCHKLMLAAHHDVKHAATDLRAAIRTLHYFRNVLAHLPCTVLTKTGITVEAYDFMRKAIAAAGSCLAAVVFQNSTPALLSHPSVFRATAAVFTPAAPAVPVQSTISSWTVEQVEQLFVRLNFPTVGIVENQVDGGSLGILCADPDAEAMFCLPAPEGMGFPPILFKGRFKKEMAQLNVAFDPPYKPAILPQRT